MPGPAPSPFGGPEAASSPALLRLLPGTVGRPSRPRGESRGLSSAARPRGEAVATHLVAALPFHRAPLYTLAIPLSHRAPSTSRGPHRVPVSVSLRVTARPRTSPLLSSPAAPSPGARAPPAASRSLALAREVVGRHCLGSLGSQPFWSRPTGGGIWK